MSFSIIIVIISFLLEGIVSKYIAMNSLIVESLFTLISLIIIYPYFHNREHQYFGIALFTGLLYDIIYTNTLCFNAIVFFIIAIIIQKINTVISNNSINVAIISFMTIILYRILVYFVLCLLNYLPFNARDLLYSIASSLVLNMIYSILLYIITDYISRKKHISKID